MYICILARLSGYKMVPADPRHRKLWAMGFTEPERDKIISVAERMGFSILSLGSFLAYPAKPFEMLTEKMEWFHFMLRREDYLKIWACIMVVILIVMGTMYG